MGTVLMLIAELQTEKVSWLVEELQTEKASSLVEELQMGKASSLIAELQMGKEMDSQKGGAEALPNGEGDDVDVVPNGDEEPNVLGVLPNGDEPNAGVVVGSLPKLCEDPNGVDEPKGLDVPKELDDDD
ncbi:unnamed protein product [Aphanomyces euteiches]